MKCFIEKAHSKNLVSGHQLLHRRFRSREHIRDIRRILPLWVTPLLVTLLSTVSHRRSKNDRDRTRNRLGSRYDPRWSNQALHKLIPFQT